MSIKSSELTQGTVIICTSNDTLASLTVGKEYVVYLDTEGFPRMNDDNGVDWSLCETYDFFNLKE